MYYIKSSQKEKVKMKYPECKLGCILNPGKYYMVSTDKEHVEEVKILEENMWKEMHSDDTAQCQLSCQMYVAVEDFTGQLRRGIIEKKIQDDLYQILLIDYGKIINIEKSNIKVITNKNFIEVEPLAFFVRLHGVIPIEKTGMEEITKPKAIDNWVPESLKFVQNIFKEKHNIIVKSFLIQKRTVYGDLLIKPISNMKFISLRKLLCRNEFCVYSENSFLKLEGLSSGNEGEELETKMQLVEKWQKDNFTDFKDKSDVFYIKNSSMNSNTEDLSSNSSILHSQNSNQPEPSVVQIKKFGLGRGKLKHLVEEMKNKERMTVEKEEKVLGKEPDVEEEHKKSLNPSEMQRKIEKPGGFLSVIDKLKKVRETAKDFASRRTLEKENSVQSSKPTGKSDESFFSKERSKPLTEPKKKSTNIIEKTAESPHSEGNIQVWKEPLKRMKFNCWTPYVVFDDTVVEPANTFRELAIQKGIIQNLEKGGAFHDLSQVQRWAIPAIRKQLNTVIIGSSKTGKTTSYVVPLIDYMQDSTYFEGLPFGNGPSIVIVASSSHVCESIYYMCHSLMGNLIKNRIKKCDNIVLAHGNGREKEVWVNLTNGCDILISTPHCLVRLLEHPILTNFERLSCLVLDEIDVISQNPFRKNVRVILERAKFATKDRHYQSIITGERWTLNVESLVKNYVKSYALIIGSSAEAVIFKNLKPNILLVDRSKKLEILLNLLEDRKNMSKILVVCEKGSEANRLKDFLMSKEIVSYLAHEKLTSDKLKEMKNCWIMSTDSVLIITDEVLNELDIKEAEVLIHFELPTKSKTNFYLRYTSLSGFLNCGTVSKDKDKDLNLQSIILVDDENHHQLPHIIDFVTRLGGKIPSKILGKCEEIRRVIEIEKCDAPICRNILSFGRCRNVKDCPQRHAFVKALDSPKNLPTSGWVNFEVLKIQHASCFCVKLLEHVDWEGKSNKMEDRRSGILAKVREFFECEDNQKNIGAVKCGDACAVKYGDEGDEIFYRAKIIEVLKVDKHGKALEVNVKLMDEGDVWKRKVTELFELPGDLSNQPPTAIDVWAVGIQPMDFDVTWSGIANKFVSNVMMRRLPINQYWSGKIVLALDEALFLEPVKRKEYLPLLKTHVFDLVLQGELINKKVAVSNNEHLPALLKLCEIGDIKVSKKEERKKEGLAVVQPQWAFFDLDFIKVRFSAAESTSTVFLQPEKFEKLLQELEDDCEKEARDQKKKKSKHGTITVGMFCLALLEDGKWNRARIESEDDTQFQVFFIDHGDFLFVPKSNVIPISETLLLRLPCQAIECSLVGIFPEEECPIEVLQEIYSFSNDGEEELYAYVVEKNLKPSVTSGRKYKINLLNQKGISLNKILIDKGLVRGEESEKKHVENIEIVDSDDDDDDDEEEEEKDEKEEEEEEEIPGGKESWENHFNNLTDDVFECEEALEFLKEFASKFLPKSYQNNPGIIPKEEPQQQAQVKSITDTTAAAAAPAPAPAPEVENHETKLRLKTKENVLTPQILWCQNQLEIQIKIMLGSVEDFNFESTPRNISFRCFVKEKFYAVDLKLFGAINPQLTKITIKGLHVAIVLTKLAFPLWPRLHADEGKHWWINIDVESLVDKESIFHEKIQSAKLAIESGQTKEGIRTDNIHGYSDSEEDEVFDDGFQDNLDFD